MSPTDPEQGTAHRPVMHAELPGQAAHRSPMSMLPAPIEHQGFSQSGPGVPLADAARAVPCHVGGILLRGQPGDVAGGVVVSVAVAMSSLVLRSRRLAVEGESDQAVDCAMAKGLRPQANVHAPIVADQARRERPRTPSRRPRPEDDAVFAREVAWGTWDRSSFHPAECHPLTTARQ